MFSASLGNVTFVCGEISGEKHSIYVPSGHTEYCAPWFARVHQLGMIDVSTVMISGVPAILPAFEKEDDARDYSLRHPHSVGPPVAVKAPKRKGDGVFPPIEVEIEPRRIMRGGDSEVILQQFKRDYLAFKRMLPLSKSTAKRIRADRSDLTKRQILNALRLHRSSEVYRKAVRSTDKRFLLDGSVDLEEVSKRGR